MADDIIDSDVDLHDPAQRQEMAARHWDVVLATSAGGVLGAEGRYAVSVALPSGASSFPWSTVIINASGSVLLGILMAILLGLGSPRRLVRPFLGVGVLGGYTTYSTFAVDAERLLRAQRPVAALGYVAVTLSACLVGVLLGSAAVHGARRRRRARAARTVSG